ncbi:MAG: hypothetical protein AAGA85_01160 [Bacteroidota bacterium]
MSFFVSELASAQISNDPAMLIKNRGVFGYITTFAPDPEIEGSYFYGEESFPITLYLAPTKDPFKVAAGNINLLDFSVLMDFEGSQYAVQSLFVDSLFAKGKWMVNARHVRGMEENKMMYFILHRGQRFNLLKEERMDLLAPTYVEALQVGNRNYTVQRKIRYYLINKNGDQYDVTKNIGDFKKEGNFSDLKRFYKGQALDFKEESDLLRFAKYADSLL